jgi:long-subunit acyl-CoA synthetase (AMP-forming)
LIDRAQAGAEFDHLTSNEDVLAYLPPAWIGQNIFSYAQWLVLQAMWSIAPSQPPPSPST